MCVLYISGYFLSVIITRVMTLQTAKGSLQFLKVTYERMSQSGESQFTIRDHGMYARVCVCVCVCVCTAYYQFISPPVSCPRGQGTRWEGRERRWRESLSSSSVRQLSWAESEGKYMCMWVYMCS